MELICPDCQQVVERDGAHARCEDCQRDIPLEARCPDCNQPLEVLKACGAVDYFCRSGHGLISKKRVVFVPL